MLPTSIGWFPLLRIPSSQRLRLPMDANARPTSKNLMPRLQVPVSKAAPSLVSNYPTAGIISASVSSAAALQHVVSKNHSHTTQAKTTRGAAAKPAASSSKHNISAWHVLTGWMKRFRYSQFWSAPM